VKPSASSFDATVMPPEGEHSSQNKMANNLHGFSVSHWYSTKVNV